MKIDVARSVAVSRSPRARQLESMFDVPPATESALTWQGEFPYDDEPWNVGLIVGPSGAGKSTLMREVFGDPHALEWGGASVIDDFAAGLGMNEIAGACQAVGFNTVPAWLRPYSVLSTGEQFRVSLARLLVEAPDPILVDEFTSVVDRQVAKIGAHALQKHVRKHERRVVCATCHYDVIDWLQPDWTFEPATMVFRRRSVQRRPTLDGEISPVPFAAWPIFAPYHYLTANLHRAARCWGLFVDEQVVAFAGMLPRPTKKGQAVYGISRLVVLPDWQGLGLGFVLADAVGGIYAAIGRRVFINTVMPLFARSFDRSPNWHLTVRASRPTGRSSAFRQQRGSNLSSTMRAGGARWWKQGDRQTMAFEYVGPSADPAEARRMFAYWGKR